MANIFHVDRKDNAITLGLDDTVTTMPVLTATRLLASNASKAIVSSDLVSWVTGTANQITVTDDSDGTITLSTPQNIHAGASPTFAGLTLSSIAAEGSDVDKFLVDSTGVIKYRTGAQVLSDIGGSASGHDHSGVYEPADASLTSIAGLTYASASFIKLTAEDTYAVRTISEVKSDLSLNLVENTAHSTDAHTMTIDGRDVSVDGTKLDGIEALADVTSTNETSHADVLVDGDVGVGVQAFGAVLDDLNTLGIVGANSEFLVGTGAGVLAWESGATLRTSLGLGTGDTPTFSSLVLVSNIGTAANGSMLSLSDGNGNLVLNYTLYLTEATAAYADVAGKGQLWVKNETPNELWFTDDAGTDIRLASRTYVGGQIAAIQDPAYSGGQSHTFDGGLIVKMGEVSVGLNSTVEVEYDDAFPNAVIYCNANRKIATDYEQPAHAMPKSGSETSVLLVTNTGAASTVYWEARGH